MHWIWLTGRVWALRRRLFSIAVSGGIGSVLIGAILVWSNRSFVAALKSAPGGQPELSSALIQDLYTQIGLTALVIGMSLAALLDLVQSLWGRRNFTRRAGATLVARKIVPANKENGVETLMTTVVPASGALFVLYQVMAGSLFATTSVTVSGVRCGNPERILVTATMERGNNWLVSIALDEYFLSASESISVEGVPTAAWKFPRKAEDKLLRLAPGEKMSAQFLIKNLPKLSTEELKQELILTMRLHSYAMFWPIPSQSMARAVLVAPKVEESQKGEECKLPDK